MPFFKKSKNKKENSAAAPPPAPADTSSEITPDKETDSRESGVTAFLRRLFSRSCKAVRRNTRRIWNSSKAVFLK